MSSPDGVHPDKASDQPTRGASSPPAGLLDLDLDELSPLPPAEGFANSRSASTDRLASLQHDANSQFRRPNAAAPSPALSAVSSSFRLEGSPVVAASFAPSKTPPSHAKNASQSPLAKPRSEPTRHQHQSHQSHQYNTRTTSFEAAEAPPARYVTVSAILSRSEMYYPPEASEHWNILRSPEGMPADATRSTSQSSWPTALGQQHNGTYRRKSQRKRPSNGSAIEALGALLLRKDSSGRVATLSFARKDKEGVTQKHGATTPGNDARAPTSKHSIQSWANALGSLGKTGLRLQLPQDSATKIQPSKQGSTIAERRAHMWHQVLNRQGAVVEHGHGGFSKVRSRRGGLTFEVGNVHRKETSATLLDAETYRPSRPAAQGPAADEDEEPWTANGGPASSDPSSRNDFGRLPGTIMLKAGRRPRLNQSSKSEFGIGSAYHDADLPEAPPSPVAMPGAWQGGSSWRSKPGDGYEEGALLLPPPLLDDHGSDATSFEGLLGVKRMREREKARKQAERLAARNRPAHKVGPLTALANFVKAAHAAETSAKRTRGTARQQPPAFFRSFTEPQLRPQRSASIVSATGETTAKPSLASASVTTEDAQADKARAMEPDITLNGNTAECLPATPTIADADLRKSPAVAAASPFLSPAARRAVLSRRGSRTNSVDAAGRQLNTVFEFEPLDPAQIPDDELASPDLPPISSPLLRPSSAGSSKASVREFPVAPRLLPVQLSMPPSPFTPLAIDPRGDYLSARSLHSAPRTPQLGPTMLSLPPSPWTPYQDAAAGTASPMIQLRLNTSTTSLRTAPGTPRLVPTHLEIIPSPFPTSAASRRGSLTYDSPHSLRAIGFAKSPLAQAIADPASSDADVAQKMVVLTEETAAKKTSQVANGVDTLRLTPSSMLIEAQSIHSPNAQINAANALAETLGTHQASNTNVEEQNAQECETESRSQRPTRSRQNTVHVDSAGRQRSFVLWFLIGDLGLRNRPSADKAGDSNVEADYGGVVAVLVHTVGLVVFVTAHLVDLAYSTYERVSLILWFLRWMVYNLAGRTVLAQCVVEAYGFIQVEWATVAMEDHEEKGSKKATDAEGHRKPKGLSRWQVLRGLLELYCLHSVTRERYLAEGAGLQKLEGWARPVNRDRQDSTEGKRRTNLQRGSERLDIGAHRAASRAALGEKRSEWAQHDADIMGQLDGTFKEFSSLAQPEKRNSYAVDEANEGTPHDDGEADDSSDDDDEEMIVTNRGDDILEFAKTPRLDPARPDHASSGYFGRAYDFMTSPQVGASHPGAVQRDLRPFKETNRDLVRTIKWCGRLAISAYGLHVHIVDLPPTFTPSGERFSRQTFAYLSRLNADDVLHADIQTLDADADYSPTFYVVRDYVRKVVCVAVRGTQSFSDIIVDLELQTEEIELPQVQPTPGEEFRCHAGIWRAAKALVSPQSKLFATLRQALAENDGFGVMFCGHSLGGAIASAAALLLAEYFIPDGAEPDQGTWVTNMSSGLPARRPIRAVSFASPVTMTADLASRAALGSVPLVTTVVLGSDVIPRVGHGQVRELRRVLGALARVRRRHAMASSEGQEDARVHILRSYWDWRSISQAEDPDDVMLHRKERIEEQLWSLRREVESDLYAAIKARLDGGSSAGARIPPSPWVGPQQREQAPLHALATRRQELDSATLRSEAAQGGPLVPPGRCVWIEGGQLYAVQSPLAFFSLPELRGDMFAAHFPAAYEEAILDLHT
ncbi:hypothetical protein PANT_6c00091 [Moesziomyces antarcticus T-34]|uniref:sn-1-specific diacylglycerol lipase n=1 Tax=Pseudozyma antarctica (strain T-34) TaxID=1151754 RepID=M9LTP8_PSEA3|nr:hypothetical protein PANT_6c00091 [Moesziomyces antarcticus T-34]